MGRRNWAEHWACEFNIKSKVHCQHTVLQDWCMKMLLDALNVSCGPYLFLPSDFSIKVCLSFSEVWMLSRVFSTPPPPHPQFCMLLWSTILTSVSIGRKLKALLVWCWFLFSFWQLWVANHTPTLFLGVLCSSHHILECTSACSVATPYPFLTVNMHLSVCSRYAI